MGSLEQFAYNGTVRQINGIIFRQILWILITIITIQFNVVGKKACIRPHSHCFNALMVFPANHALCTAQLVY